MDGTGPKKKETGGRLTSFVTEQLRRRIKGGELKPGERLPTERALMGEFGVSRTVIREAIAGLRADGLVVARQGAGVFVLEAAEEAPFLAQFQGGFDRISSIIEALELRTGVEIEAVSLAATRSSPAQQMRIREAADEFAAAIDRGERAEAADYAFHLSIADATNNRLFREFLESLGKRTIPRSQIGDLGVVPTEYLLRIKREHHDIADAITSGDAAAAAAAMRAHLRGSQERYRKLMQGNMRPPTDNTNLD